MPCILLDTIFWRPGWQRCPADEFRAAVRAALDQSPRGWVVDGNYTSKIGTMVTDAATDVICEPYRVSVSITSADGRALSAPGLDPPLVLYFPRLCWRTLLRLFRVEEQCSAGCEESARKAFFSRESIILW